MKWSDIPSLSSLRAFEAAARHGSYTRAADELNVTHAAIAQHVRSLEKEVGASLMVREGRGMALTADGKRLSTALVDGFGQIANGVRQLREAHNNQPLAITTTPSFAENWLMPRLGAFWAAHPGLTFSITPSMDLVDLHRDPFDMGIRYGSGEWPNVVSTFLLPADYVVVATPELLQDRKAETIEDLSDLPWIFEVTYREEKHWAINNGLDLDTFDVKELPSYNLILSAIRSGAAVSVVKRVLVDEDIKSGRLKVVQQEKHDETGYYIIERPTGLSPDAKTLKRWLLSQA